MEKKFQITALKFLTSNWYFFIAASIGKEIKPRNPRKRKVNKDFFIHTERESVRERLQRSQLLIGNDYFQVPPVPSC